ncbi:MAG: nitroreductase family protein [Solobacterium sp.]|nr:nitroreductase family protein [Solobacterium sp.]
MDNEQLAFLRKRRSIRKYKPEQITDEQLQALLDTAVLAATAKRQEPWYFLVIQKPEILERLQDMTGLGRPYFGAPTLIVGFARADAEAPVVDTTLAMSNIMNAAVAVGLGTCWMNNTYYLFRSHPELSEEFGVPKGYTVVGALIVGVPDQEVPVPTDRRKDVIKIIK